MARSVVRSRFLSLRHTKITLTNTENISVASLSIHMGERGLVKLTMCSALGIDARKEKHGS